MIKKISYKVPQNVFDSMASIILVFILLLSMGLFSINAMAEDETETAYIPLPRPFLFNLQGPLKLRTLQIKVQLMVRSKEADTLIQKHIPLVEDAILKTFSSAEVSKLNTQIGKQELRQKTLLSVQNVLRPLAGKKIVDRVLFTGFVMQ